VATDLFAGLLVSDLDEAVRWWSAALGLDPLMFPNDTEAVWELGEHRYVYVDSALDGRAPGQGVVTLFLSEDLEARVESMSERGIEPISREAYDNGVRKVTYTDPDGNLLGLGAGPAR
jgi:catechol 2,3-dioxygenase-like lactoylglutathione lyase family enzyme